MDEHTAEGIDIWPAKPADVGGLPVGRVLPRRAHRTVGAWCFLDHMGPATIADDAVYDIAPHPHIGLQTVTWLFTGEALHRDSLGTEQQIRPGQLNLMTAGNGVSHSEEQLGAESRRLHGVQLWVALPDETRAGPAAFEHHGELPRFELGSTTGTVLIGDPPEGADIATASPARRDTDHFGYDLHHRGGPTTFGTDPAHEHAVFVVDGAVRVDDRVLPANSLAYVAPGRDELLLDADRPAHVIVLGGTPFPMPITMFWNYVGRSADELRTAHAAWQAGDEQRFGVVSSPFPRTLGPA